MAIPTPDQSWVFETEKSHAARLVSILSCDVNSSSTSPTDGPGTTNGSRSFTIVDTHQPALVYSTHPPSLLPPETLKYLTRVFRLDGTCSDAGWLLHHPRMRALVCNPKCTCDTPSASSYSLQPRDTGARANTSLCVLSIVPPFSPPPSSIPCTPVGTFALKTHPKSIAPLLVDALSCREKSNNLVAVACSNTCNCSPKALCEFRASESTATHLLHAIFSPEEGLFRWGVTATSRASGSSASSGGGGDAVPGAGREAGSTLGQAWANYNHGGSQAQDYALLCAGVHHLVTLSYTLSSSTPSSPYATRHTSYIRRL